MTRRNIIRQEKKRTRYLVGFAVPADHRLKMKEIETGEKNLDLARKLRKRCVKANEWIVSNRIISVELQYLKSFNCAPKN